MIFVADSNNSTIRKILYNGTVTTIAGSGELGGSDGIGTIAKFFNPIGITTNKAGNLFIADNNKIRKIVSN